MNFSWWTVFLILTCVILSVRSEESKNSGNSSKSALGIAACSWYGPTDDCEEGDPISYVPCDKLPPECTSHVWESVTVTWTFDVYNSFYAKKKDDPLDELIKCKKPLFINYGYSSFGQWTVILACCANNGMNIRNEMKGLVAFINLHKSITGLILINLDIEEGITSVSGLTENLITYIGMVKETFPELEIGLSLLARTFVDFYDKSNGKWLDFKKLNDVVNFYVIAFSYFNDECTAELINGMVPLSGNAKYTMEKALPFIEKAGLAKDKLHFKFITTPRSSDLNSDVCKFNFESLCHDPAVSCNWCSDNTQTLYDKGVFTHKHAQGFIYMYVDLDDPHGCCNCNGPYPGFYAFLAGFNFCPKSEPCKKLDRI